MRHLPPESFPFSMFDIGHENHSMRMKLDDQYEGSDPNEFIRNAAPRSDGCRKPAAQADIPQACKEKVFLATFAFLGVLCVKAFIPASPAAKQAQ